MPHAVLSLSGGLDSTVLLAKIVAEGHQVTAINFQYGSKHNPHEIEAARAVASHYGVPLIAMDLTAVMGGFKSALMKGGEELPEGHYEEDSMKKTVVPGRNLIFISILAGLAESIGADFVALGIHAGDHNIYPDCRPKFIEAASSTIDFSSDGKLFISAPFLRINKTQIVLVGQKYGVPFQKTRTCYSDKPTACGKCGSCQERLESFCRASIVDPIDYACRDLLPKSL